MVDIVMTDLPRIPLYTRFADYAMQKNVQGLRILVPHSSGLPQAVQRVMLMEGAFVARPSPLFPESDAHDRHPRRLRGLAPTFACPGAPAGPWKVLTFAAKDLFDVARLRHRLRQSRLGSDT